jgi:hypothetical protein
MAAVTEGQTPPSPTSTTAWLGWLLRHPDVDPPEVIADHVERARRAAGKASRTFNNNKDGPANHAGR